MSDTQAQPEPEQEQPAPVLEPEVAQKLQVLKDEALSFTVNADHQLQRTGNLIHVKVGEAEAWLSENIAKFSEDYRTVVVPRWHALEQGLIDEVGKLKSSEG